VAGEYILLDTDSQEYLTFQRKTSEQSCLIILNMSDRPTAVPMVPVFSSARVLFSSQRDKVEIDRTEAIELAPFEVFIAELG
jgi:hypothetical protein